MALEFEDVNEYGVATGYHRVDNIEYDFSQNAIHFDLLDYTNRDYREVEIEFENKIKEKWDRYKELESKGNLRSPSESAELAGMDYQYLLNWKDYAPKTYVSKTHYTVTPKDEIRIPFYKKLTSEIDDFYGGDFV